MNDRKTEEERNSSVNKPHEKMMKTREKRIEETLKKCTEEKERIPSTEDYNECSSCTSSSRLINDFGGTWANVLEYFGLPPCPKMTPKIGREAIYREYKRNND